MDLAPLLRCPECGSRVVLDEGASCLACGRKYARRSSVLRFVPSTTYADSFGFQWKRHEKTQLDPRPNGLSERMLREGLGLSPDQIEGRTILDAGCGAGRYSEVLSRWGGRIVSMDLSEAVEACHNNLSSRGVLVIQGDIYRPPLADQSFDCIVSVGVLDHTPDPGGAFDRLVRLLKPGGRIGFWVYHAYHDDTLRMKLAEALRRLTPRLPVRVLYCLCHLAVPWYYLNRVPVVRSLTGRLWHASDHPQWRWRVLDTFDWYSPRYQSHHTYAEVWNWFHKNGLTDIRPFDPPVAMTGRKP